MTDRSIAFTLGLILISAGVAILYFTSFSLVVFVSAVSLLASTLFIVAGMAFVAVVLQGVLD